MKPMYKTPTYFHPTAALQVVKVFTQLPAHLCTSTVRLGVGDVAEVGCRCLEAGGGDRLNSTDADGQKDTEVLGSCSPRLWSGPEKGRLDQGSGGEGTKQGFLLLEKYHRTLRLATQVKAKIDR